jgi:type I restriction enzyme, S subunit
MKLIAPELSLEYSRTILQGHEVLVNVRGTLGGVAVVSPDMKGWNVSREVAVIPVDTARFDPDYIAYWVGSDDSQRSLRGMEKGVAYTGINLTDLRTLPVLCPPIEEQRRIVERIRAGHSRTDLTSRETDRVALLTARLDKTLLEKAFRGELV